MAAKSMLLLLLALPAVTGSLLESEQDALLLQVEQTHAPHRHGREPHAKKPHSKKAAPHAKKLHSKKAALISASDPDADSFGDKGCPCIALDGVTGVNLYAYNKTYTEHYPAEVGSACKPWDKDLTPGCRDGEDPKGKNTWCANSWCYVDPCNCNLESPPKVSVIGGAQYQGHGLFFSYSTCGNEDSWSKENHKTACVNQKDEDSCKKMKVCAWTTPGKKFGQCLGKELVGACGAKVDEAVYGKEGCECIGIDGRNGTFSIDVDGKGEKVDYPITMGATCTAWDDDTNPECKGDKEPAWCKQKWCYVDPCTCKGLDVPPKKSVYVEKAKTGGHPVYYSYKTCGEKDTWTEKNNKKACPNQKDQESCSAVEDCSWTGTLCLKTELADACGIEFKSAAWGRGILTLPALLVLALGATA